MDPEELILQVLNAYSRVEERGFVTESVSLHEEDFRVLGAYPNWRCNFDQVSDRVVLEAFSRHYLGSLVGYLWGASVFVTRGIPRGTIICLPALEFMAELLTTEGAPGVSEGPRARSLTYEAPSRSPKKAPEPRVIGPSLWDHLHEAE